MTLDKSEFTNFSEYSKIILLMENIGLVDTKTRPQNENNMGDSYYE